MASAAFGRVPPTLWYIVLAWCLGRGCCADDIAVRSQRNKGKFLLRRLSNFLPVHSVHLTTEQALTERLIKLRQEADFAVKKQSMLMEAEAQKKRQEAMAEVEKEIPLAEVVDTATLEKEVAKQNAEIQANLQRSQKAAQASLALLRDQTEKAVNMTAVYEVGAAEKHVLSAVQNVQNQSSVMIYQADLLAKEAKGAANYSLEAAKNSELWVNALPVEEAAGTVAKAKESQQQSISLMRKTAATARTAKLAGNLAIDTIRLMEEAEKYTAEADADAIKAVHQASQNAMQLNNIRQMINTANTDALKKIAAR
mmetsp:Transcript_104384/g.164725  ORF Transcript_104384/g.164725 Transcript_104384/m.164725 type:complete len:311 (+) Transcript_104384:80-1012(+)